MSTDITNCQWKSWSECLRLFSTIEDIACTIPEQTERYWDTISISTIWAGKLRSAPYSHALKELQIFEDEVKSN